MEIPESISYCKALQVADFSGNPLTRSGYWSFFALKLLISMKCLVTLLKAHFLFYPTMLCYFCLMIRPISACGDHLSWMLCFICGFSHVTYLILFSQVTWKLPWAQESDVSFHQWYFITSSSREHRKVCQHTNVALLLLQKSNVHLCFNKCWSWHHITFPSPPDLNDFISPLPVWLDWRIQAVHARFPGHISHCFPLGCFVCAHKKLVVWRCIICYSDKTCLPTFLFLWGLLYHPVRSCCIWL